MQPSILSRSGRPTVWMGGKVYRPSARDGWQAPDRGSGLRARRMPLCGGAAVRGRAVGHPDTQVADGSAWRVLQWSHVQRLSARSVPTHRQAAHPYG